jgi:uncharacterized protein (DUF433 family)
VRRWLLGYSAPGHKMEPVFGDRSRSDLVAVSFLELSEIAVVAAFREMRVPLQRLRDAHQYARDSFGLEYPFASLNLKESGGHVLHDFEETHPGAGRLAVLDQYGQFVLPQVVGVRVLEFDFDNTDRLAARWFPFGREIAVVIDPHVAAGTPTVKGTRIAVETVRARWKAGEVISSIASDLEIGEAAIEQVLQRAA